MPNSESPAGVIVGFQVTVITLRLNREIEMGDRGERTWIPVADYLNLASFLVTLVAVFVLPAVGIGTVDGARVAFGLAALLLAGWPFAILGHYKLYPKLALRWRARSDQTESSELRGREHFPKQERMVVVATILIAIGFLVVAILNRA